MRVLLNDNHTPHAAMVAAALPEVQFVSPGWNETFRPLPTNLEYVHFPACLDYDYDAVIDDSYDTPTFQAKTKLKVFLQHCEYNQGPELPGVFERSDRVVVVSDHRRATMREMGLHSKVVTIPPGLDVSEWTEPDYDAEPVVGTAGNGWNWNYENREMAERVGKKHALTVIGHHNEDTAGVQHIARYGLDGYQSALREIGIFVYCVVGEVLGMAPMEAMASGIPVVMGSYPEAWNFAFSDWNCLITRFPPTDSVDWMCEQIQRLKQNPELRRRIGQAGRATMRDLYPLELHGQRWRKVLGS